MNPEASYAEKICLWKFLNIFPSALHLPCFYMPHNILIQKASADLLTELLRIGVSVICFEDSLYNQHRVSHPTDFLIHKHNTYQFILAELNVVQGSYKLHMIHYLAPLNHVRCTAATNST
jgi:hypothetical protein